MPKGLVIRSTGSHYQVRGEDGRVLDCVARGQLRIKGFTSTNPIAVGDHVVFEPGEDEKVGSVIEVLDRKNYLVRRSVNLSHQKSVIAANIDQALLMVTPVRPRTSTGFIDRFLVTAEAYEIPCVILLNKVDSYNEEENLLLDEMEGIYRNVGYRTFRTSALNGTGVEEVKELLRHKVSLLAGHSGVGKSTLINTIEPGLMLHTSEVSERTTKGTHTTTFAEMHELTLASGKSASGGRMAGTQLASSPTRQLVASSSIIDTPGIKGFGLVEMDPATISDQFPEMFKRKSECRFASCLHLQEPGCAVIAAVEEGTIAESRYRSYVDMVNGVEEEGSYRRD